MLPFDITTILLFAGIVGGGVILAYYLSTMERPGVMRSRVVELYDNGLAVWRKARYHVNPEFKLTLSRNESIQLDEKAQPYICRKRPTSTSSFPLFVLFQKQAVRLTTRQPITNLTAKGKPKDDQDKTVFQKDEDVRIEPLMSPVDLSAQAERSSLKALMSGSINKTTIMMLIMGLVFGAILGLWASQYMPPPTSIIPPSTPGMTQVP